MTASHRTSLGWAMLVGLGLTGCPTAADLDTPYDEYEPIPTVVTNNNVTSSTTSPNEGCDDTTVNEGGMYYWCGTKTCHGTPESNETSAPLWLFSPNRSTELLNLPATEAGCTTELIINTASPERSLILTSMNKTTPEACGIEMPKGIDIPDPEHTCIEQWVYSLVAAAP
ncbi:MAG TPA: hypothetical protein VI197_23910 [Polyangiaceae bacterium]